MLAVPEEQIRIGERRHLEVFRVPQRYRTSQVARGFIHSHVRLELETVVESPLRLYRACSATCLMQACPARRIVPSMMKITTKREWAVMFAGELSDSPAVRCSLSRTSPSLRVMMSGWSQSRVACGTGQPPLCSQLAAAETSEGDATHKIALGEEEDQNERCDRHRRGRHSQRDVEELLGAAAAGEDG